MESGVLVAVQESTDVSAARRAAMRASVACGFSEELSGAAAIAATEAASNLLKHAGGGELLVSRIEGGKGCCLELLAFDKGPGLLNRARCFEDGYSTAGGAGTGLGAIARLSQFCDIYSTPECGTVLVARFGTGPVADEGVDLGIVSVPFPGEEICGDTWAVHQFPDRYRIMIADGLGHGPFAAEASQAAASAMDDPDALTPASFLQAAHLRLKSTRGAAASVADLHFAAETVDFAGLGNVAGTIVTEDGPKRQMISHNGTLGHELRKVQQFGYPLAAGSLVVLHSDGLSSGWSLDKYPGLFHRHPSIVAGVLFRDFRRTRDDATVLVVRARSTRGET